MDKYNKAIIISFGYDEFYLVDLVELPEILQQQVIHIDTPPALHIHLLDLFRHLLQHHPLKHSSYLLSSELVLERGHELDPAFEGGLDLQWVVVDSDGGVVACGLDEVAGGDEA